jgi:hypothetical protein
MATVRCDGQRTSRNAQRDCTQCEQQFHGVPPELRFSLIDYFLHAVIQTPTPAPVSMPP